MGPDFTGLSELEHRLLKLVVQQPSPGRHAARSAIHHIERALKIKDIDPEMAAFRAITGEEEAARAIIHALQRLRYPNASRLNWKTHRHKAAVVPFLAAVGALIEKGPIAPPKLQLVPIDGEDAIRLQFELPGPAGKPIWVYPNPPLHLQVAVDDQTPDFSQELTELLSATSISSVDRWIESRAAERNHILYASEHGIPAVDGNLDGVLSDRRNNIFSCVSVFLLIDKFPAHQNFVLQCLPVFLRLLALLPKTPAEEAQGAS